ncbi:MAG: FAD-dependent oxidoreductase [Candidatus Omnitrophica bacterium]|nr:FAD-dependent oxidoreductase [Candidatus Omnitrophota bacterium]
MTNLVIIGASVSSHNIAVKLREKDKNYNITIVSEEDYLAYDHLKLPDFIDGTISEEQLFLCNEGFYQERKINFLKARKIGNLNSEKKSIYFKDRGSLVYDLLVIASGRSPSIPDVPGAKKEGVYRLYSLDDTKEFLKRYIAHPVCVVGSNNLSLKTAEAVSEKYGVEVKLLSRSVFDPQLIPRNLEVIHGSVQEIIGEGQTQAVKLKDGKAIGVCAVLFMDDYKSNIDFLKNTELQVRNDFIVVDGWMRTTNPDIFACGSVTGKDSIVVNLMLVDNLIKQMKGETCQRY